MYSCRVSKGAVIDLKLPADFNSGILILEGRIKINDKEIALTDNFCLFKNDRTGIKTEALEDAIFLVLSGKPINEPIVSHGPFLMNTAEEIQQAMRDFGRGNFGHLK